MCKVKNKDTRKRHWQRINADCDYNHFTVLPKLFLRKVYFSKIFMELLMENKEKVMDNYLLNLKFTVSKAGLKILCHVALICAIFCIADMICTVACQEIEVVRFLGLFHLFLFLNYVNQTTKSNLSKNYYQIRSTEFPKQKTNFLPPR